MSHPSKITQQLLTNAAGVTTGAPLPVLQNASKRMDVHGTKGMLALGGPLVRTPGVVTLTTPAADLVLTPDQILETRIHIAADGGGNLKLPTATSIINYITNEFAQSSFANAAAAAVNAQAPVNTAAFGQLLPIVEFEFEVYVPNGVAMNLVQNTGVEIRKAGFIAGAGADYALVAGAAGEMKRNLIRCYITDARIASPVVTVVPVI